MCTNTYGGFNCTCTEAGYTGSGFVCGDADECVLFCGHGEPTTMSAERATNPFLRDPRLVTGGE